MRPLPSRRRTLGHDQGVTHVTRYTPQQIATVHALRQHGCTYQRICALTGWSYSAVQRMVRLDWSIRGRGCSPGSQIPGAPPGAPAGAVCGGGG